ncbi:MAG: sulfatase-like hydrolase/transferase [Gammaproteobacteria bacterium]|nr:sulfatase-like hydrolase/transferase [Gammaproteobacteria bacterium]
MGPQVPEHRPELAAPNWTAVIPFFSFPSEVCKIGHTTNAIGSRNASVRKAVRNKRHFPSDQAATRLIWLALRHITMILRDLRPHAPVSGRVAVVHSSSADQTNIVNRDGGNTYPEGESVRGYEAGQQTGRQPMTIPANRAGSAARAVVADGRAVGSHQARCQPGASPSGWLKPMMARLGAASLAVTLGMLVPPVPAQSADRAVDMPSRQPWKAFPNPPQAPKGAPNVLVIMTDDVGFGASSTFGGPVPTPALDQLASAGLRYNTFGTTAMCSPTRAALLTGRNHHAVGFGVVAELATDSPGYDAIIPDSAATIARVLGMNGYDTAMVGKNHNTPLWERTPLGPFNHWPTGLGFDYFYGFNGGWSSQFAPELVENTTAIDPPRGDPAYTLERDLADHAIRWLKMQHNLRPSRPFFLYYAPATSHAPHQAPADWIARFDGQFTQGWDQMRAASLSRQQSQGIIPAHARLTPRPDRIPAWDSLTREQQQVAARYMQVYAAALSYADAQIGRVIDSLRVSGQWEDTLVIFVQGDNGAAAEDLEGSIDLLAGLSGHEGTYAEALPRIAELGGPSSMENYPVGWAWAMNTPFQWSKLVASHFGGTRNGLVISWPGHTLAPNVVRSQFHHVIDIAPTIYEAVGISPPAQVNGVQQEPIAGVSMVYSFSHPAAPSARTSQYFELMGNRAFYQDGWIASTTPGNMPWTRGGRPVDPDSFHWELYDLTQDYSQAHDLAAQNPAKLAELQAGFKAAAQANHVLPLDASTIARLRPGGQPSLTLGRSHFVYTPSPQRYEQGMMPDMMGDWRLSASVTPASARGSGMIAVRGNLHTGWGLFQKDGVPGFIYRVSSHPADIVQVVAPAPLAAGPHQLGVAMVQAERNPAAGGTMTLTVDGRPVASARVPRFGFSYGLFFVGRLAYEPLKEGEVLPFHYEGAIDWVSLDIGPAP